MVHLTFQIHPRPRRLSGADPLPSEPVRDGVGPRVRYPLVLAAVDGIVAVVPRGQGDRTDATLYVGQSCLHPRVADAELGKEEEAHRQGRELAAAACAVKRVV